MTLPAEEAYRFSRWQQLVDLLYGEFRRDFGYFEERLGRVVLQERNLRTFEILDWTGAGDRGRSGIPAGCPSAIASRALARRSGWI